MPTPIQKLKQEIKYCEKQFKKDIQSRIDCGDLDDLATPEELLDDCPDNAYGSTAWEAGYLQGLKLALNFLSKK